jgi:hypothetical protein
MKEKKVDSIRLIKILGTEVQARVIMGGKEMHWQRQPPEHPQAKGRAMNVNSAEEVYE